MQFLQNLNWKTQSSNAQLTAHEAACYWQNMPGEYKWYQEHNFDMNKT